MGTQRNEADKLQSEVWIRRTKKSHQGARTRTEKTGGKTQRGERRRGVDGVKTN